MTEGNILLGVNIDHVATLREARGTNYPEPVHAALMVEHNVGVAVADVFELKKLDTDFFADD